MRYITSRLLVLMAVVLFIGILAAGGITIASAESKFYSAPEVNAPTTEKIATYWQVVELKVLDPSLIPDLYFEADLVPIQTITVPGQPTKVVRGWGWDYDYGAVFTDNPTLIEPLGARYIDGKITGRAWSRWGIPGDMTTWTVATTAPPEDPYPVLKIYENGQKFFGTELLAGVIPIYNIEGDTVIRALIWVWGDGETVRLRTWQVAVGRMVPADPSFYREDTSVPDLTNPYDFSNFAGGRIEAVHLTKVETFTNGDSWYVVQWKADRFTVQGSRKDVFDGGLSFLEPSIYENMPWYVKALGDTWDPSRLVGQTLCPYQVFTPLTYLWGGEGCQ